MSIANKAQALLDAITEETSDMVFAKDLDGRYTLVNPAAARFLQTSKKKAVGKKDEDLLPQKIARGIINSDKEILESGTSRRLEETLNIAGNERVFQTIKAPCRDEGGKITGLIGISRDITEQKLGEKLKESNERLRKVIVGAPIILFAADKDGIITVLEGKGLEMLGKGWGENVGKSVYDIYHDQPEVLGAFRRALAGEIVSSTFEDDRGSLEATFSPIFDGRGMASGVIGVALDVTRRKRMKKALQRSQENLAEAQRIAHLGNMVWDLSDNHVFGSDEAWRLFGLPPQKQGLAYDRLLRFVHPDDRQYVENIHNETLAEKKPYDIEYRVVLPGNSERTFRGQGEIVFDGKGRPIHLHSTVQDVTRHKRTEEALRKKDSEIRKAYADVFSAVTQEKLLILTAKEIDGAVGEPISPAYFVSSFEKVSGSRTHLREVLKKVGISEEELGEIIMASSEAVTNGVKHGDGCEVQVYRFQETFQIRVSDRGPGIDFSNLPKATLVSGFSTKKSLGMGFSVILEIFDRVLLATDKEGTTLVLETGGREEAESN